MPVLFALAAKDLRILARVRAGWFFTFIWPLIIAVLFGFVFAGQSTPAARSALRVAVIDEDASEGSRRFIARMHASGDFAVTEMARADAENAVRRGASSAFVAIKPGFGESAQRMFYGDPRHLELGVDPSRGAESAMLEGLLTKLAMEDVSGMFTDRARSRSMVADALRELGPQTGSEATAGVARFLGELDRFLQQDPPAPPGGGTWQPLAITHTGIARERRGPPNAFAITFAQGAVWGIIGCVMTFAIGLVGERIRGTYVRLGMAPLTRAQILGGKALACFASILLVEAMLFTIAWLVFDVRPASPLLLLAAGVCAAIAFVGFMMLVASLGRTEQAVAGVGWALFMPLAMFGGAMMPQFVMPAWMIAAGNLSPIKWTILAIEGAVWRGFSPSEMLLPCAILLTFGAVCFAIGVRALRD